MPCDDATANNIDPKFSIGNREKLLRLPHLVLVVAARVFNGLLPRYPPPRNVASAVYTGEKVAHGCTPASPACAATRLAWECISQKSVRAIESGNAS